MGSPWLEGIFLIAILAKPCRGDDTPRFILHRKSSNLSSSEAWKLDHLYIVEILSRSVGKVLFLELVYLGQTSTARSLWPLRRTCLLVPIRSTQSDNPSCDVFPPLSPPPTAAIRACSGSKCPSTTSRLSTPLGFN